MPKSAASTALPPKATLVDLYRQAIMADVELDRVDQKVTQAWERLHVSQTKDSEARQKRQAWFLSSLPLWVKVTALVVPIACIATGLILLGSAVVPILSYYVQELPLLRAKSLTSPIPNDQILEVAPVIVASQPDTMGQAQAASGSPGQPLIITTELDYTNLGNWFGGAELPDLVAAGNPLAAQDQTYSIDIPSLKITNAVVTIGSTNLNKSLIQYPGTAEPGQPGSPVIFGHSVLRQFYNPSEKNPRRYNSIFSTIMTLKKGDLIYITRDNVKYTYMVQEKTEVKPEDTHILAQKYDQRTLKLVTCTPEGTYLRRGVVTAVLVPGT